MTMIAEPEYEVIDLPLQLQSAAYIPFGSIKKWRRGRYKFVKPEEPEVMLIEPGEICFNDIYWAFNRAHRKGTKRKR